ncbi:hypothetical protein NUW58_g3404 [Xylaria curta]|uniref:Uncharacterized protein n=1 Tax=Xylaria curta TaxID=42375 RepID=A0ACC1PE88_9PEZI|nr:hypothetical protein NUW58_g3404 [Xylaria curta]
MRSRPFISPSPSANRQSSTYVSRRGTDGEASLSADPDSEVNQLLPCRQRRHRVRIQGRLAIVRTVSIVNLRQTKHGSPTAHMAQKREDLRSIIQRGGPCGGSEGEDGDEDDGAVRDAQFRGYGIGGAGNIRRPTDVTSSASPSLLALAHISSSPAISLDVAKRDKLRWRMPTLLRGVAASGIAVAQVAAQVGKSIVKLKQLWDDFHDAPSYITDLLCQIDCFNPALWEAENTFSQASLPAMFWDNDIASQSTTYCRKALTSLTELIDDLTLQLNQSGKIRRKFATAKVVLKTDQLKRLERRLQNAVTMLTIAQQSYHLALARMTCEIITRRFTAITVPRDAHELQNDYQSDQPGALGPHQRPSRLQEINSADASDAKDCALMPRRSANKRGAVRTIRFQLPLWLSRTTWELQTSRSYGNWKLNLRYYSILPYGSEVFYVAGDGTPKDLQVLFTSGLASPYVRDEYYGDTLLHWAIYEANMPMVKYLLDIGLSPFETNYIGDVPIQDMTLLSALRPHRLSATDWIHIDKLCGPLEDDFGFESTHCKCEIGLISKEFLRTFQSIECRSHAKTTLESRLERIWYAPDYMQNPMIIPDLLEPYWSQGPRALCIASTATDSLIHIVAEGLGRANGKSLAEWGLLAEIVISNTPDISGLADCPRWLTTCLKTTGSTRWTPLMVMFGFAKCELKSNTAAMCKLKLWLQKVQSAGYDLEEYGRRESELLADEGLKLNQVAIRVTLWSYPEKSYAADFWRLVEDGPQVVPGAWVEDSEDEDD